MLAHLRFKSSVYPLAFNIFLNEKTAGRLSFWEGRLFIFFQRNAWFLTVPAALVFYQRKAAKPQGNARDKSLFLPCVSLRPSGLALKNQVPKALLKATPCVEKPSAEGTVKSHAPR